MITEKQTFKKWSCLIEKSDEMHNVSLPENNDELVMVTCDSKCFVIRDYVKNLIRFLKIGFKLDCFIATKYG